MSEYKAEAWRISGYYPGQYAKSMAALGIGIDYSDDDYDRYEAEFLADLAAHDADVRKAALAEAATKLEEWAELWATQDGIEALMFAADDVAAVLIVEKLILAQAAAIRAAALGDAPTGGE